MAVGLRPHDWYRAGWIKFAIVGLAILALMPRPFANATLEVVTTSITILGLMLYFVYRGMSLAARS